MIQVHKHINHSKNGTITNEIFKVNDVCYKRVITINNTKMKDTTSFEMFLSKIEFEALMEQAIKWERSNN